MIFLEMFVAFAATMAFAVIFNVSRSELIFCGQPSDYDARRSDYLRCSRGREEESAGRRPVREI